MRNSSVVLITLVFVQVSFGQPHFQAILRSEGGTFTAQCDGSGDMLDGHTLAFIYWDSDHDGPDSTDGPPDCVTIPGWIGIPEYALCVNFYNFGLTDVGTVESPVLQGWFGIDWPGGPCDLYIRIFVGQDNDSCYTSPVFTLLQSEPPQEIILYYSNWTCGLADVNPPPCHASSYDMSDFYMSEPMPQEQCLQTCPGAETAVYVFGNQNPSRPPVMEIIPGCGNGCAPTSRFSFNQGAWARYGDVSYNWFGPLVSGEEVGCVTVRLIDHIPSAQLDTFFAMPSEDGVQLVWHTDNEISLDMFELWRPYTFCFDARHIADVEAENDSNGASYNFIDTTAFDIGDDYTLVMVDNSGIRYAAGYTTVWPVHVSDDGAPGLPKDFALAQNYPNPFNPTTTIRYDLPQSGQVRLTIFNLLGQEVARLADGRQVAGSHTISWDAADLPSGIYLCRMEAEGFTQTRKLMLLK